MAVASLGTGEFMLTNKRRDSFETARRLDLAVICLKRVGARGGEILVPTSVKLAVCHYKKLLLDQFSVTRVDTEVVIADCGEEHVAHPTASAAKDNDSGLDWSSGVLPKKRRVDAPVSQASPGLLESPAMFTEMSSRTS